jgi:hypothetical protein
MTIKVLWQLDSSLSRYLSWRKKELTQLKFCIDTAPSPEQRTLLRAGVALLYAHWEGFIKESATAYLELVANQVLRVKELTKNFKALAIRTTIRECGSSDKINLHCALIDTLQTGGDQFAKIPWRKSIKTKSNLRTSVLKEIVDTLGLNFTPFQIKSITVIDRLVRLRNVIAHGKGAPVDTLDYDLLHTETVKLLDEFKTQIEVAASSLKYKAAAQP